VVEVNPIHYSTIHIQSKIIKKTQKIKQKQQKLSKDFPSRKSEGPEVLLHEQT